MRSADSTTSLPFAQDALILDVGGTSMKWLRLCDGEAVSCGQVSGFNPYRQGWTVLAERLDALAPILIHDRPPIYYFGAGLANTGHQEHTKQALLDAGIKAEQIKMISTDLHLCVMMATSRDPVVVGILGTGSSVMSIVNGRQSARTKSLGFYLGDEGSGSDIGLQMIRAYQSRVWSTSLQNEVTSLVGDLQSRPWTDGALDSDERNAIINAFAKAAHTLQQHPQISELIETCLLDFVDQRLRPEWEAGPLGMNISIYGGTAAAYQARLAQIVEKRMGCLPDIYSSVFDQLSMRHEQ